MQPSGTTAAVFPTTTKGRGIARSSRFSLGTRLVTNGEYLAFIEAGGYQRPEFWLSLGWTTVNEQRWQAPLYWEKRDGAWWNFTLSGFRPVDEAEPVTHVSYFEADAFANWTGARLPTEFEWERAAPVCRSKATLSNWSAFIPRQPPQSAGLHKCLATSGNGRAAPTPLPRLSRRARRARRVQRQIHVQPMVLRGGSCATSQSHIRPTYRNFFQPEKRWQFTGIRLARDLGMNRHASGVAVLDLEPAASDFLAEAIAGLSSSPRLCPSKFFYDERGSDLFQQICELPEYYVTRTETEILRDHGAEIAESIGENAELVGFGTGAE